MILLFWGKILSSKQILICKYVEQQTLSVYFCLDGGFYLNSPSSWNWHLVLVPHSRNEHRISLHLSLILLSTYFPYPITNNTNPCCTNSCDTLLFSLRCMWVKSSLLIVKVWGGEILGFIFKNVEQMRLNDFHGSKHRPLYKKQKKISMPLKYNLFLHFMVSPWHIVFLQNRNSIIYYCFLCA